MLSHISTCARACLAGLALSAGIQSGPAAELVISQIYGGGGNAGAAFKNDFIELHNRGSNAVNLAGWSVQYAPATSANWQPTALSGMIGPGEYFLVQEAAGANAALSLPAPDAVGSLSLGATAGKVALVSSTVLLSGACPTNAIIVDLVGYGSAASCFLGGGPASSPGNAALALLRASDGCADSRNNVTDFLVTTPGPRNRAAPANVCGVNVSPVLLAIHDIQGSDRSSPHVGQAVLTTTNIVTGLRKNGFFLQSPDADADNDPETSEGIFVFTSGTPPAVAAIGNAVTVAGIVTEFWPASDPASPPRTQLNVSVATNVTLISTDNPLPAPVTLTAADTRPDGPVEQLERYEGMRVHVAGLTVCGPTLGNVDETTATAFPAASFTACLAVCRARFVNRAATCLILCRPARRVARRVSTAIPNACASPPRRNPARRACK